MVLGIIGIEATRLEKVGSEHQEQVWQFFSSEDQFTLVKPKETPVRANSLYLLSRSDEYNK